MMEQYGMAVIGLGVVGRRMLEQVSSHHAFKITAAYDTQSATRSAVHRDFPQVPVYHEATQAIENPNVDIVYVAVPPLAHAEYARAAMAAGKAVFCEKPLGVDVDESTALVRDFQAQGALQAVNFVFASSAAVQRLREMIRQPDFDLRAIEIEVRFHQWPRAWQAGATWLNNSNQGGFTREVLSHYVYLLHCLMGAPELRGASVRYPQPGVAETAVSASLQVAGIPVSIASSIGGRAHDVIEVRCIGANRELRLVDWYQLLEAGGGSDFEPVRGLPENPRQAAYQAQLDQLAEMLSGRPHTLPDFATALSVQRTIETLLKS
jgi:predicted dehydrogenase